MKDITITSSSKQRLTFSEQEFECVGHWEEDGLIFTYTRRKGDTSVTECYVSKVLQLPRPYSSTLAILKIWCVLS